MAGMKSIGHTHAELPVAAPIMVLPNAVLFPHALMPLFIFEPRYRVMLAHTLEQDRMFCVAMMKPGVTEAQSQDDFHHVAGIGLVRACVGHENGTSHLVLQGLARVRFGELVQDKPFRIAQIRELQTPPSDEKKVEALGSRVREACLKVPVADRELREKLKEQIAGISHPGALADLAAHAFLEDPVRQQEVLEELDLAARLRMVLQALREES
jgi:Lon protease-like protein